MLKYGRQQQQLKLNVLLLIGLTTTVTKIARAYPADLQHPKYDFIDVAKETANGRNRGQTTRIFTTGDDLDETFWLKYLGEEFRNAVHLQVDDDNNIVPVDKKETIADKEHFEKRNNNIETKGEEEGEGEEKRTRFVRQPSTDNKHIPVEPSLYNRENNQYPTEKPETFNIEAPTDSSLHNTKNHYDQLYSDKNNKKLSKSKKKILIHNKYKQKIIKVKPPSPLKAIHEPIVVNLLEAEEGEHQINREQVPLVVQMPPVVYHQKADLYPEHFVNLPLYNEKLNLYNEQIGNGPLNHGKPDLYSAQKPNLPQTPPVYHEPIQNSQLNQQIQGYTSNTPQAQQYSPQQHHHHQHYHPTADYSIQHNSMQHNPLQHNSMQHSPSQQSPIQHNSIQHNPVQHNPIQHNSMQHSPLQQSPTQHNPIQIPMQHSPMQHNSIQHNSMQHSPIQHNPLQHNPMHHSPMQHNSIHNPLQHNPLQHSPIQQPSYPYQNVPPPPLSTNSLAHHPVAPFIPPTSSR